MKKQREIKLALECSNCFVAFFKVFLKKSDALKFPKESCLCDYCMNNLSMTSKQLLLRRIDCLESAFVCRFPTVIKQLLKHIELKDCP